MYRKQRVESLLREELNKLLKKEAEFPLGAMVTVMRVELQDEGEQATVWVSIFPKKFEQSIQKQLGRMTPMFGGMLVKRLRMQYVPKIHFRIDNSNETADEITRLLDALPPEDRQPPETEG